MRWTGVTRKDIAPGSEHYIGQARTLLGMVQARIDGSGGLLKQFQMWQRFKDGTRIFAQVVGEQRLIRVWYEPVLDKEEIGGITALYTYTPQSGYAQAIIQVDPDAPEGISLYFDTRLKTSGAYGQGLLTNDSLHLSINFNFPGQGNYSFDEGGNYCNDGWTQGEGSYEVYCSGYLLVNTFDSVEDINPLVMGAGVILNSYFLIVIYNSYEDDFRFYSHPKIKIDHDNNNFNEPLLDFSEFTFCYKIDSSETSGPVSSAYHHMSLVTFNPKGTIGVFGILEDQYNSDSTKSIQFFVHLNFSIDEEGNKINISHSIDQTDSAELHTAERTTSTIVSAPATTYMYDGPNGCGTMLRNSSWGGVQHHGLATAQGVLSAEIIAQKRSEEEIRCRRYPDDSNWSWLTYRETACEHVNSHFWCGSACGYLTPVDSVEYRDHPTGYYDGESSTSYTYKTLSPFYYLLGIDQESQLQRGQLTYESNDFSAGTPSSAPPLEPVSPFAFTASGGYTNSGPTESFTMIASNHNNSGYILGVGYPGANNYGADEVTEVGYTAGDSFIKEMYKQESNAHRWNCYYEGYSPAYPAYVATETLIPDFYFQFDNRVYSSMSSAPGPLHMLEYSGNAVRENKEIVVFAASARHNFLCYSEVTDLRLNYPLEFYEPTSVSLGYGYKYRDKIWGGSASIKIKTSKESLIVPGLTSYTGDLKTYFDYIAAATGKETQSVSSSTEQTPTSWWVGANTYMPCCTHPKGYVLFSVTDISIEEERPEPSAVCNVVVQLLNLKSNTFVDIIDLYNKKLVENATELQEAGYSIAPISTTLPFTTPFYRRHRMANYGTLNNTPKPPSKIT